MAQTTSINRPESVVYHVVPLQGGRWEVMQEGGTTVIYDDKQTAITAAVELARSGRPGTVKVHGPNGSIESERTYGTRDRRPS